MLRKWFLGFAAAAAVMCAPELPGERLDLSKRTVSHSRQFIVYASERDWRGGVATVAEDTKSWFLGKLRLRDEWKYPVVIAIERASAARPDRAPAQLKVFETGLGPKIQLDLVAGPTDKPVSVQTEILRVLLAEIALRGRAEASSFALPPEWLVTGFNALRNAGESGPGSSFYETLLASGTLPSFEDFINRDTDGMDSTSLQIHQACAAALVQALLDMPEGRKGLVTFLQTRKPGDDAAALQAAIPAATISDGGLEKWWSLGLARLSASERHESRGVEVSATRLSELLLVDITDEKGKKTVYRLSDFEKFIKKPDAKRAMGALIAQLAQFSATANPLFVPLVELYAEAARQIASGKTRGLAERIAEVDALLKRTTELGSDITDYLNWVEATQPGAMSGSFDKYLKASRTRGGYGKTAPRTDAISLYLNSIEMEIE